MQKNFLLYFVALILGMIVGGGGGVLLLTYLGDKDDDASMDE